MPVPLLIWIPEAKLIDAPETEIGAVVVIEPPIEMPLCVADRVKALFPPVIACVKESVPVPVWVNVVAPAKLTGPVKVAVVPWVVLLFPCKEMVPPVSESVPVEVGPNVT